MSSEDFVWPPTGNEERNIITLERVPVFPRASRVDENTLDTYTLAHMRIANTYSTARLTIPPNLIQTEVQRARGFNFDLPPNQDDCIYVDVHGYFTFDAQFNEGNIPMFELALSINVIRLNVRSDIPDVPQNLLARAQIRDSSVYGARPVNPGRRRDHGTAEDECTVMNVASGSSVESRSTKRSQTLETENVTEEITSVDLGNRRITRAEKRRVEQDRGEKSSTTSKRRSKRLEEHNRQQSSSPVIRGSGSNIPSKKVSGKKKQT